ncbi:hypothetical protein TNCV_118941 [Trichonephila clavipes]|nr:hypothetical protein TNCV_118941 [Trichonephila clavipes]
MASQYRLMMSSAWYPSSLVHWSRSNVTRVRGFPQATRVSRVVLSVEQRLLLSEPPRDRYKFRMRPQAFEDKRKRHFQDKDNHPRWWTKQL